MFGSAAEGILGAGAWNCRISAKAEEYCRKYRQHYDESTFDWWGDILYYASLQFFEQAVEKAGTLDQKKIRDVMATERFETVLGETWFENGRLAPDCLAGQIGQWQNGVFEVVAPKDKATSNLIVPKPAWPVQLPENG
jgi:branched-chain amino acid transport system substrate-binding protein